MTTTTQTMTLREALEIGLKCLAEADGALSGPANGRLWRCFGPWSRMAETALAAGDEEATLAPQPPASLGAAVPSGDAGRG